MPETRPVAASTVALVGALLLHKPPEGVEARAVVLPMQVNGVPVIVDGTFDTVTTLVV
jgi:hypothetical protein